MDDSSTRALGGWRGVNLEWCRGRIRSDRGVYRARGQCEEFKCKRGWVSTSQKFRGGEQDHVG